MITNFNIYFQCHNCDYAFVPLTLSGGFVFIVFFSHSITVFVLFRYRMTRLGVTKERLDAFADSIDIQRALGKGTTIEDLFVYVFHCNCDAIDDEERVHRSPHAHCPRVRCRLLCCQTFCS